MKTSNFLLSLFNLFLLPFLCLTSFLSTVDLNYYISSQAAIQITGEAASNEFGYTVSNGDINGDGYDDMVIGAPFKNTRQGEVYVIYGGPNADLQDLVNLNLGTTTLEPVENGFTITGNLAGDFFGITIGVCDVDDDGYDDIIIGAPNKNNYQGIVYVIYGGQEPILTTIDLSATTSFNGFTITGNNQSDYFGGSISSGGDINKDGYDDIIIGSPTKNLYKGAVYVIYGGPKENFVNNIDLSTTTLDPQTTGFFINGSAQGNNFGCSISHAGDLNNDGYDDILIGAMNYNNGKGAAYVIYGRSTALLTNIDLSMTSLDHATTGFMILGDLEGDRFGYSVHLGGDINADEYEDMIVGAPWKSSNKGAAYVIYGGPTSNFSDVLNISQTSLDPLTNGFTITGNAAGDYFGYAVDSSEGNETHGWAISTPFSQSNMGILYIIYGQTKPNSTNIDLSSYVLDPSKTGFAVTGVAAGSSFGLSVTVGDFNNDDLPEILVGSSGLNTTTGAAYLLFPSGMCSYNCSSCTLPATCQVCSAGYGLENYVCEECTGATYSENGEKCLDCISNCEKCSDGSSCEACEAGYAYINSECEVCPTGTYLDSTQTCQGKFFKGIFCHNFFKRLLTKLCFMYKSE